MLLRPFWGPPLNIGAFGVADFGDLNFIQTRFADRSDALIDLGPKRSLLGIGSKVKQSVW